MFRQKARREPILFQKIGTYIFQDYDSLTGQSEQESLDSRNAKLTTNIRRKFRQHGGLNPPTAFQGSSTRCEWSTVPVSDEIEPKEEFPDVWKWKVGGNLPNPLIENPIDTPEPKIVFFEDYAHLE